MVVGVDASFEWWEAILQQKDENKGLHLCHYESVLWSNAERRNGMGKCEWHGPVKALKKIYDYIYRGRFLMETDVNTLVHQQNLPANDLPGALVTRKIPWIRLFDSDVNHIPGRPNGGPDGLLWRPRGERVSDPVEKDNLEKPIEARLRGIWVEQGTERERKTRTYKLCVGLRLAEEYGGRWMEIGEKVQNLKWLNE